MIKEKARRRTPGKRTDILARPSATSGNCHKKAILLQEKLEQASVANKKARRKLCMKYNRAKVETSLPIRRVPWVLVRWRDLTREIQRAVEELNHLDRELKNSKHEMPLQCSREFAS